MITAGDGRPVVDVGSRLGARLGFEVVVCDDLAAGWVAVAERRADVAAVDLRTPDDTGADVVRRIGERSRNVGPC